MFNRSQSLCEGTSHLRTGTKPRPEPGNSAPEHRTASRRQRKSLSMHTALLSPSDPHCRPADAQTSSQFHRSRLVRASPWSPCVRAPRTIAATSTAASRNSASFGSSSQGSLVSVRPIGQGTGPRKPTAECRSLQAPRWRRVFQRRRRGRRRDGGRGGGLRCHHGEAGFHLRRRARFPPGKKMGHAGAIVMGDRGIHASKPAALERTGVEVLNTPSRVGSALRARLAVLRV